jgi:nitrate reductase gamma subunit
MNGGRRLSTPLYEGVPAIYVVAGLAALGGSYQLHSGAPSALLALGGLAALIAGLMIWLRRREYRRMRANYPGGSGGF